MNLRVLFVFGKVYKDFNEELFFVLRRNVMVTRKRLIAKEIFGAGLIGTGLMIMQEVYFHKGGLRLTKEIVEAVMDGNSVYKDLADGSKIIVKRVLDS